MVREWGVNNENDGDPAFFYDIVLSTVAAFDQSRPLWPASPSSGFRSGVVHETGLPDGSKLKGLFQKPLDTHQPYNFCDETWAVSTQEKQDTFFKSEFGQVPIFPYPPFFDGGKGSKWIRPP